jgi:hypothetical protein
MLSRIENSNTEEYTNIVEEIYRIEKLTDEETTTYGTVACFRHFLLLALNAKRSGEMVEDVMRYIGLLYVSNYCVIKK